MRRERALKVVLILVGLLFTAGVIPSLWIGEQKLTIGVRVKTSDPALGNGTQFVKIE
jgi:hypothetical protein